MPHPPRIAFEVWDFSLKIGRSGQSSRTRTSSKDPVAWAKKSMDEYGAELIALATEKR